MSSTQYIAKLFIPAECSVFSLLCSGDGDQTSVEYHGVVLLPVKL